MLKKFGSYILITIFAKILVKKALKLEEGLKNRILKAVKLLGDYFPFLESCINDGHYAIKTKRLKSEKDEIFRCLDIFADIKNKKPLQRRLRTIMFYYLKMGYSKETKNILKDAEKITMSNISVANTSLRKQGYIYKDKFNESKNHINDELLKFKKHVIDNKGENIVIKIEDEGRA